MNSELTIRTATLLFAECIAGAVIGVIFFHFSRVYKRRFLKTWSSGWLAFFIYTLSTAFVTLYGVSETTIIRHLASYISITACIFQVFFLLLGCYELVFQRSCKGKTLAIWAFGILLLGFMIVFPYADDPTMFRIRYLLRLGSRYSITSLGFLAASLIIVLSPMFTRGIGKMLMATSFLVYGLVHTYYVVVVVGNWLSYDFRFPFFFGIVELVAISIAGLSMVIWLLEDERKRLVIANSELDSFLYRTSHDLRAPIASSLGLIELAQYELREPESLNFLTMMKKQIQKLDFVISDISSFARNKKAEPVFTRINLNELIDKLISKAQESHPDKRIRISKSAHIPASIHSDYYQLQLILSHLIDNAFKYQNMDQPDPYIVIDVRSENDSLKISVVDNGVGISENALPKIFEMFYRGNVTSDGTGLGLYMANDAVKKINAIIQVESQLGKGSVFTLTLHRW